MSTEAPYIPFSKRLLEGERAAVPIPYQYDDIPAELREQIIHIWRRALGQASYRHITTTYENRAWNYIHNFLAEEHGLSGLPGQSNSVLKCHTYLRSCKDHRRVLDIIEVSFRSTLAIAEVYPADLQESMGITQKAEAAIADLNRRFNEHAVGYRFTNRRIIRVDSEFLHTQAVEPALALLHEQGFRGASDEFLQGHKHFREGAYKDAVTNALKAVESTLKAICDARNWPIQPGKDAVGSLISLVMKNGLIPDRLQKQFTQVEQLLLGLATVRNSSGGHGQGATVVETPDYLAAYALHQAAANIVLLVEAHKALP